MLVEDIDCYDNDNDDRGCDEFIVVSVVVDNVSGSNDVNRSFVVSIGDDNNDDDESNN